MGKYWLLDRHGDKGPSVLVETNGSMQVVEALRFGPAVTELDAQQQLVEDVMGRVAPTMKPMVAAAKLDEVGIDPHPDLQQGDASSRNKTGRSSGGSRSGSGGRVAGGPKRTGGRGRG